MGGMAIRVFDVLGAGNRYVLDNAGRLAALAVPLWLANIGVERGMAFQAETPGRLLALPFLVVAIWFSLPLLVTIYRSLPDRPEPAGIGGLFRLGRHELRLALGCLAVGLPAMILTAGLAAAAVIGDRPVFSPLLAGVGVAGWIIVASVTIRLLPGCVAAARGAPRPLALGWRMSRGRFWMIALTVFGFAVVVGLLPLGVFLLFVAVTLVAALLVLPPVVVDVAAMLSIVLIATLRTAAVVWGAAITATLYCRLADADHEAG